MEADQISRGVVGLFCQSVVGSLIGAVILRAACSWYNSMVGRSSSGTGVHTQPADVSQFPTPGNNPYAAPAVRPQLQPNTAVGVPEPDFGRAWMICFVTFLVNAVVGFVLGAAIGLVAAGAGAGEGAISVIALVVAIPVGFGVFAGILSAMLPTSFGRAAIVTLLYLAVCLLVGLVIGAIVFAVMFAIGMNR